MSPAARVRVFTLGDRPDLAPGVHRLVASLWPPEMEYIHHDPVCGRLWGSLYREFADFQPVLCDGRGLVIAAGFTIPVRWKGRRALRRAQRLDAPPGQGAGNVTT